MYATVTRICAYDVVAVVAPMFMCVVRWHAEVPRRVFRANNVPQCARPPNQMRGRVNIRRMQARTTSERCGRWWGKASFRSASLQPAQAAGVVTGGANNAVALRMAMNANHAELNTVVAPRR